MNIFKKRNFRFGSLAVALSAVVIALVVLANGIISGLASRFGWYFDMTSENLYQLSDESRAYLSELDGKNQQVTIYFMTSEDRLNQGVNSANYYGESGYWGMQPIHQLAKELADCYDYISVDYIDLISEPDRIADIVGDRYDSLTFSAVTVLVDNYVEYVDAAGEVYDSAHQYRMYSRDAFYSYDYYTNAVAAFLGDYRLCSAIRSITLDRTKAPTVYFLSGHGEAVGSYDPDAETSESADYGDAQFLWQAFRDSGYEIRKIDLRYEDFDAEGDGVAVIYAPTSDYITKTSSEKFDEIAKLTEYLSKGNHSLLTFLDPRQGRLSGLEDFLEEIAGVSFVSEKLKDNGQNSTSVDGYSLVGSPVGGNEIMDGLQNTFGGGGKLIFRLARPIRLAEGFDSISLCSVPDSVVDSESIGQSLLSMTTLPSGSRVVSCGSSHFVDGFYMDSDVYANHDLMLRLIDEMNESDRTSYGIPVKVIRNEGLDLTTRQATILSVLVTAALPLLFAVIGTVVYVRRRYS